MLRQGPYLTLNVVEAELTAGVLAALAGCWDTKRLEFRHHIYLTPHEKHLVTDFIQQLAVHLKTPNIGPLTIQVENERNPDESQT